MLRLTNLANKYKRRTLRALYAQTQAYPYAATLDTAFQTGGAKIAGGQIAGTATTGITGALSALNPGAVMIKQVGEIVTLSSTSGTNQRPFGLCANFVGGQLDELYGGGEVGVWRGAGGVFEILAPFFDATGGNTLATDAAAEDGLVGNEIYMASSATGVLKNKAAGAKAVSDAARLVSYLSANAIVVELLV